MTRPSRPLGSPEAIPYFNEARRKNAEWHEKHNNGTLFGVAKPVRVFDDASSKPQWRLRTQTCGLRDPVKVSYAAIDDDGRFPPDFSSADAGDTEASGGTRVTRPMAYQAAEPSEHDKTLRIALATLIDEYRACPGAADQRAILHLLHRLQIYARGVRLQVEDCQDAFDPAGLPRCVLPAATLRGYLDFFEDLRQRVECFDNVPPNTNDAADDLKLLKRITGYFRDRSLVLADITDKLAAPSEMRIKQLPQQRARLQHLVARGLQKLTCDTPEADLRQFLRAFTLATRCFHRADRIAQSNDLNALVGKVVSHLGTIASVDRAPLFDFFKHLSECVTQDDDDSQTATYQALLLNEEFNLYVERLGGDRGDYLSALLDKLVRDARTPLWQAGADMLVRRSAVEFCDIITDLVDTHGPHGPIDDIPLQYTFARLNEGLKEARERSTHIEAAERYNGFLERLADVNGLHALSMRETSLDDRMLTLDNLHFLYGVDPNDMGRLDTFFSNAIFRAAAYLAFDGRPLSFEGRPILRDVEALLQQTGANPVSDCGLFEQQLKLLKQDYKEGLPQLRGLVLRSLGDRLAPGMIAAEGAHVAQLRPVETWLRDTAIPAYNRLIRVIVSCYPLSWQPEPFSSPHAYTNKVIMGPSGQMFVARHENGQAVLHDLFGRGTHTLYPDAKATYNSACNLRSLMQEGDAVVESDAVRLAIRELANHHNDFEILNLTGDKAERMDALQATMMLRLKTKSGTLTTLDDGGFERRLAAMGEFFRSVAPFRQAHLESEARRRFFRGNAITDHGRDFIKDDVRVNAADPDTQKTAVLDRLFKVGCGAAEKVVKASTDATSLCEAVKKLDRAVRLEMDIQSFSSALMVKTFNKHHQGQDPERSSIELDADKVETLRKSLYEDAEASLKALDIAYIMPNQALAAELCRRADLENENILLKMGTGQGKSIVIAATALYEARRLKEKKGQYVFVLTGLPHLVGSDHETGRQFFAPAGVESVVIAEASDLDKVTDATKIIYADAKTLQGIAQKVIAGQIRFLADSQNHADQTSRLPFLHSLYQGAHRFILDEYDLVLNDLDYGRGFVTPFFPNIVDYNFVKAQGAYAPNLAAKEAPDVANHGNRVDGTDGRGSDTINAPYISEGKDKAVYNLRAGALRISKMLANAQRIIGLSGSARGNSFKEVLGLENVSAKYFELPSSRDPDSFGTLMVDSREQLDGVPGIWRTKDLQLPAHADEAAYIAAIVSDVQEARKLRPMADAEGHMISRPVLVFVDPTKENLYKALRKALHQVLPEGKFHEKFKVEELEGPSLQEIGLPGNVTLTSILCGRGVDIHVSLNVPDGMHIVVGTSVATERLLTQVRGRTGRMGQDGSYSIITLGRCVPEPTDADIFKKMARVTENLLHDLSSDFIGRLMSAKGCNKKTALQWLLLASELSWFSHTQTAQEAVKQRRNDFVS